MQAATRPEFIWESPDHATEIHLQLDVVDGILHECMRGLGAVPKRGAEVGGVLLGSAVQEGGVRRVTIDGFEAVPIEYRHGPSYLLSQDDDRLFNQTMLRLHGGEGERPLGFVRANTRDEMVLTADDIALLDRYFPEPGAMALMIRPYATKLSTAGFFFRREGLFEPGVPPAGEFPFRRRELVEESGQEGAESAGSKTPYRPFATPEPERTAAVAPIPPRPVPARIPPVGVPAAGAPLAAKPRKRWIWAPLSFIFLVIGVLLGFQAALSVRGPVSDPYDLGLSVTRTGDALTLHWNRGSAAIRQAKRGVVYIDEGQRHNSHDLLPDDLQNGTVMYPTSGSQVRFRLEVFTSDRDSIGETLDWRQ